MIRAGSLRHSIQIMTYTSITNDYGEVIKTPVVKNTTRASVSPITGKETFNDGLVNSVSHKITISGKIDVQPEDEIIFDNRTFDIEYILDYNELGREKLILAIEKMDR